MTSPKDGTISGEFWPELVPVMEPGTLALALQQPANADNEIALGDLLSDTLFGEVIDISDLIPRLSSPSAEVSAPGILATETAGAAEFMLADGGDALAAGHAAVLTILYDDAILDLDKTTL